MLQQKIANLFSIKSQSSCQNSLQRKLTNLFFIIFITAIIFIMINILFFGSSIHSLKIINALQSNDSNYRTKIIGLVSQPDRPSGRHQENIPTPVSEYAQKNNLPLFQPQSLHDKPWEIKDPQNLLNFVKKLDPDIIIAAYFGQKIPPEVINFPERGSLNIHPSLLPKYPGSSPAVWAILCGEKQTGVTILKMSENFDAGEIIAQVQEEIKDTDTPEDLYERLFAKGAALLIKILPDYLSGKITPRPQSPLPPEAPPAGGAKRDRTSVYARRLTRKDGKIDWSKSPEYLERFIRAMSPWPGAWTEIKINGQTKKLKILKSHLVGAHHDAPASTQKTPSLILDLVQLEGKNPVSFRQFQEGHPDFHLPS